MKYICYPKCGTCKKAEKWMNEKGLAYEKRDIKEEKPSYDELKAWIEASGKPVKKFFNTSGLLYKEMGLKDKLAEMTDEEKIQLLATDGMLVKRPILVVEGTGSAGAGGQMKVLVGFKEAEWEELI